MFKGIGASAGIAFCTVCLIKPEKIEFETKSVKTPTIEKDRVQTALQKFTEDTAHLVENVRANASDAEAAILESHILIASDPEITGNINEAIESEGLTAEAAIDNVLEMFKNIFASMDDELLSQRASDLVDIKERLLRILTGSNAASVSDLTHDAILVIHDLTPSDTGQMNKALVKGIITEVGGYTSHSAIISRAMEIPAVLGVDNALNLLNDGDVVLMNGATGEITVNPSAEEIERANTLLAGQLQEKKELEAYIGKPSVTADNIQVELVANIGSAKDLESVLKNDAEGIGLFRTEFLFMDRTTAPSEEEQFLVYKEVAETMQNKPVIIRTLDIGGDKEVPYLHLEKEDNPFLGYRAIRLCLDQKDIFKIQIRAILRASAFGHIKIMIPMISTVTELRAAKAFIDDVKAELKGEGVAYNAAIEVGIMVETPAAVAIADILAAESSFFSIGTNDLTQYTMAVDRGNKKVAYLYSTFDPAVIRNIETVIRAAKKEGIMVGMCGEAASDPLLLPFLLAAGLDEFSMTAVNILKTRRLLANYTVSQLKEKLATILSLKTTDEVVAFLSSL